MKAGRLPAPVLAGLGVVLALASLTASCVRREVDTCRETCACKTLGRCARAPGGADQECAPATDADCKDSIACRDAGHCTRKGLECVVGSDDDCKGSRVCESLGACTKAAGGCVNTNPPPVQSVLHGVIR